ncbi:MAG: hypothetical protein GVY08_11505 [Bacteroidetes bacterium]|jgi:hypothetical protein|nr:hypothetical protein [Bacteroidota bacterium]
MMKYVSLFLAAVTLVAVSGCDSSSSSFDESLPDVLTLTITASPGEGGTVTPAEGEFVQNEEVSIEADPSDDFIFERWQGDFESEDNPATVVMNDNKTITALFRAVESLLQVDVSGEGEVRREFEGQTVSLTALPDAGWAFSRWEGDLTGSENPESLLLDEEKSVTAIFEPQFLLVVEIEGEGRVEEEPDKELYDEGESVTLTATPDEGWEFIEWQGDASGTNNSISITMDADKTVTALFEPCILCPS